MMKKGTLFRARFLGSYHAQLHRPHLDVLSYISYILSVYDIETTEEFDNWLGNIQDGKTQKIIIKRIRTMSLGSFGETRSLEDGLFEAKIRHGPGFRLYFVNRDTKIIVLLCGGDKSTQKQDIKNARKMAKEI